MRMRLLILMSIVIILADFGCKDNTIEVIQPRIKLSVEDLGVTEVWLKISIPQDIQHRAVTLRRDDSTILIRSSIISTDTIVFSGNRLSNHSYTYKLYDTAYFNHPNVTSLIFSTMDTTSHDLIWEVDTLGDVQSRVYGLWGSDENNVYAVGYFNTPDWSYCLACWNGIRWQYLRPAAIDSIGGLQAGNLVSIYGLNSKKIWVVGSGYGSIDDIGPDTVWGFVAEWDGKEWKNISPDAIGEQFLSLWAISENDLWVGSVSGNVYHYNGITWSKINTGNNYSYFDIWGFSDKELYISGVADSGYEGGILKYNGESWDKLNINYSDLFPPCRSVWGVNPRFLFVTSFEEVWTNSDRIWQSKVYPGNTFLFTKVRGTAKNNIFICGYSGIILHYNGFSFRNYETQFVGSETWGLKAIQVFNNTVFIGGSGGYGFDVRGIILRGRRG
jgi:hypothetical protein